MTHAGFNACNTTSSPRPLPSRRAPGNEVGVSVVQNEVTNESDARVCSIHSLCLIISAVDAVTLKTGLISHVVVIGQNFTLVSCKLKLISHRVVWDEWRMRMVFKLLAKFVWHGGNSASA